MGKKDNNRDRKKDHIDLAFLSQLSKDQIDNRFFYEPILNPHPENLTYPVMFLGKSLQLPIWVSSMTGGTKLAKKINYNLARLCNEFGMGMGLGSCRMILDNNDHFEDFNVRPLIGDHLPLFGNLGIAQIERIVDSDQIFKLTDLVELLSLDGIIVHVNPLQEFLQPEGDKINRKPIETITSLLEKTDIKIIVKEVGQGFGMNSLKALFQLPLAAIDFGASGGTNFALLELMRDTKDKLGLLSPITRVGHSAEEMVLFCNELKKNLGSRLQCQEIIISGGVTHFLDGYYLINKLNFNCVYGQASKFLQYAKEGYKPLATYMKKQAEGLVLSRSYLRLK
jgi:isopentenyl-diphosphate delta-isomerase